MNKPTPPVVRISSEQQVTAKVDQSSVLHQRMDRLEDIIQKGFATQDANYELLRNEVQSHGQQILEMRVQLGRHSDVVKGESKTNLEQDAAISKIATEVAEIKANTESIQKAVVGVVTNPKVKAFARFLFTLAMGYAAAKGIKVLP